MRNSKGVRAQLSEILSLYSKRDRRRLKSVAIAQIFLSLLDLFGVAMIGALSALSVVGIQSRAPGKRVESLLKLAHLENLSFRTQVLILATSAVSAMVIRSFLSVYINKRILFFIALQTSRVSGKLTERLMELPLSEIKSASNQQRLFEVTSGVSIIGVGIVGPLLQAIGDLSLLIILIAGLFSVDVLMTFLAFSIFSSIAFIGYSLTRKKIGRSAIQNTELSISSSEKLVNMIDMYREYYLRNSLKSSISRFEEERMLLARHTANLNFYPSVPKYFLETSIFILVLALGAFQFSRLDASHAISTLAIFLAAASRIAPASLRIQQAVVGIRNNIDMAWPAVELKRKLDFSEENNRIARDVDNEHSIASNVHYDLVAVIDEFKFSNESQFKLEEIKLVLPEGTSLAVVGPSGSGKSTLIDLLLGFLDAQNSTILFGGRSPINCIKEHPGIISYVPQEIPILNGSIAENISLAPEFSDSEIWLALSQAHLDDFVRTLPQGIKTEIGDRGIRLSGGQRQRIGLARALYTKPKLLILDEATSALDSTTEANISESLQELKGNVSTIIVAHRLSTVRTADKILYLDNGRALAEGTFNEVRERVPNFDQQAKLMGL